MRVADDVQHVFPQTFHPSRRKQCHRRQVVDFHHNGDNLFSHSCLWISRIFSYRLLQIELLSILTWLCSLECTFGYSISYLQCQLQEAAPSNGHKFRKIGNFGRTGNNSPFEKRNEVEKRNKQEQENVDSMPCLKYHNSRKLPHYLCKKEQIFLFDFKVAKAYASKVLGSVRNLDSYLRY